MTYFSELFAGNPSTDLNSAFGESVTYTPDGGAGVTRTVRIQRNGLQTDYDSDGKGYIRTARVIILRDGTTGVASPAIGDAITFDSLNWNVTAIEEQDGASTVITVSRFETVEKSKQNHRR